MNEMRYGGNIFLLPEGPEAAVVTTNGIVKKDGTAVMGAGIAKYARDSFADVDKILGLLVSRSGNHSYFLGSYHDAHRTSAGLSPSIFVMSMPTKNDWREDSDIDLIRRSAIELSCAATKNNIQKVYMPAPGCTNGRLDYISQVRPILQVVLDSRFTVCLAPEIYDRIHHNDQDKEAVS